MIVIYSPLKREFIKELLDQKQIDEVEFSFVKQQQMKIYFNHTNTKEKAISVAKKTIKASEFGPALYFLVEEA